MKSGTVLQWYQWLRKHLPWETSRNQDVERIAAVASPQNPGSSVSLRMSRTASATQHADASSTAPRISGEKRYSSPCKLQTRDIFRKTAARNMALSRLEAFWLSNVRDVVRGLVPEQKCSGYSALTALPWRHGSGLHGPQNGCWGDELFVS